MFEGDKLPFHLYLSLCVLFLVTKKRLVLPFGCFLTGLLLGSLSHLQDSVSQQPPGLVPVNQQALLSNITAFVTFLCVHNIEALKQA